MREPRDRHWSSLLRPGNAEPETCDHLWLKKAGSDYRANPAEICAKCDTVRRFCPNCGEQL